MTKTPRYFFQLHEKKYLTPADMIARKPSTFAGRTRVRIISRTRFARPFMIRVGLWTGDVF